MSDQPAYIDLAAGIVSAFVGHNAVRLGELPELITSVHASLAKLGAPPPVEEPAPELKPAVPVKKSVSPDYLISLEDGKRYKALRRHLSSRGMTPDDYRAKWGLPKDYPMVAPSYAATRSKLALATGLGRKQVGDLVSNTAPTTAPEETVAKKRGRPKKVRAVAPEEEARMDG